MPEKKVAIISDIHGNSIALQEVVKDVKNRGIETIINLGDSLYGPLDPKGTFEILQNSNVISISGNQDRVILENLNKKSYLITLEYVKSQIDDKTVDWLRNLPFDLVLNDEIYCCHATPQSDSEYLLENLQADCVKIKDKLDIDKLLTGIRQNIVVCGHSYVPNIVETDNKLILNPGSVGLPAYDDKLPVYHKMQNHNTRANYAILRIEGDSISVDRISIEYDHEKAAKLAQQNKRDDWAKWIREGIV